MTLEAMIEEYRGLGRALHQLPPAHLSAYPLVVRRHTLRDMIKAEFATGRV